MMRALQPIFDIARKWRQRRESRAAGPYLSKHALDDIINCPHEIVEPAKAIVPYVIFQVRDDPLEDVQRYLSRAITIAVNQRSFVENVVSSIVSVVMLQPVPGFAAFQPIADAQEPLIEALLQDLGSNVRAVYGCTEGLWGNFGSPRRFHFGAILPRVIGILDTLGRLEFGTSMKIE
jgi:hypothetical protein